MLMKKHYCKRTAEEKEKILKDINLMGSVAGCRRYNISSSLYYEWLEKYNTYGIEGLEDRKKKDLDAQVKKLEKENKVLKELLAEKDLESRMKDDLLKKKIAQWDKGKK